MIMWKLSPKILFLYLTFTMLINGDVLQCRFSSNVNWSPEDLDYCSFLNDNEIFDGFRARIDSVEVFGLYRKTIDHIRALSIYGIESFNYFPENLAPHFNNIIGIKIQLSNLLELKKSDLEQFKKLQYLYLIDNKLTVIEANLFERNPKLKYIYISENHITHIDPKVFDNLANLNYLRLEVNCTTTFGTASTRSEVLKFIERIRNGECSTIKVSDDDGKNETFIEQLNAANLKIQDLLKSNNELLIEKQTYLERINEVQSRYIVNQEAIIELNTKNQMCSEKLLEIHQRYENLLYNKLNMTVN